MLFCRDFQCESYAQHNQIRDEDIRFTRCRVAVIEGRCEWDWFLSQITVGFIVDDLGPDQLVIERSESRNSPATLAVISTITGVPLPRVVREISIRVAAFMKLLPRALLALVLLHALANGQNHAMDLPTGQLLSQAGATFRITDDDLKAGTSFIAYGDMRFTDPANTRATESNGSGSGSREDCRGNAGGHLLEWRRAARGRCG